MGRRAPDKTVRSEPASNHPPPPPPEKRTHGGESHRPFQDANGPGGAGAGAGGKPPLSGCLDENSVLPTTYRFRTAGLLSFWDSFWGPKPRHTT